MTTDYIPRSDDQFFNWVNNFYSYALLHFGEWQVPSPDIAIAAPLQAFAAAYAKCQDPNRGKADVLLKDETRATLVEEVRKYYNARLRFNDLVTVVDREKMGFTLPRPGPAPSPTPTSYPEAERIDLSILRQVTIHFRDHETLHKAKPPGVHGCEIRWSLLDAPPVDVAELTRSDFDTNSPVTLAFTEGERGKRLYFCLRWEGNTGKKGPFGKIDSTVVP
jgi:hypothetical protein